MGGFSKHNVKRKYEDCRFDYKNISSMKFIKKKSKYGETTWEIMYNIYKMKTVSVFIL